jgi:hypothetical protein
MSRDRKAGGAARLDALLAAGDHARAGAEARKVLADPGAPDPAKAQARAALASLRPEPAALSVGLAGALLAVALLGWLLTR